MDKLNSLKETYFANPTLLEYNITCHICLKKPVECLCNDRWLRLRRFYSKLCNARAQVCLGFGGTEERKLTDKFGI